MKITVSEITVLLKQVNSKALPRKLTIQRVKEIILFLIKKEGKEKEINVVFTNDRVIKKLNKEYRYKNTATDVLSFEYKEEPGCPGEIVISLSAAKKQADNYGNTYLTEVVTLLVHGFFHINGFRHYRRKEYLLMKKKEQIALKMLMERGFIDE